MEIIFDSKVTNEFRKDTTRRLYADQQGKCYYCQDQLGYFNGAGVTTQNANSPTFDHKILKANGGVHKADNGVCACLICNQLRGPMSFSTFRATVTDVSSRDSLVAVKSSLSPNDWFDRYPNCTEKPKSTTYVKHLKAANATKRASDKAIRQAANAKEAIVISNNKANMLSSQNGRCACCNAYTLDIGRTYEDMTEVEYLQHPQRPLQRGTQMVCSTCYVGEKRKPANKLLTFLGNLLK